MIVIIRWVSLGGDNYNYLMGYSDRRGGLGMAMCEGFKDDERMQLEARRPISRSRRTAASSSAQRRRGTTSSTSSSRSGSSRQPGQRRRPIRILQEEQAKYSSICESQVIEFREVEMRWEKLQEKPKRL